MAITIQERDSMHSGIQRPLSSLLATKKEYTWDASPTGKTRVNFTITN